MVRQKESNSGIVYSTEQGRMCLGCGKPIGQCLCEKQSVTAAGDGVVKVGCSTKGRRGKFVSLVTGVPFSTYKLQELSKALKKKCGTGGTVKDGVIEIQGDHRDKVAEALRGMGYKTKFTGG